MSPQQVAGLRGALGLSQLEFGRLFGAHAMTVSKWERGVLSPTPYQALLMGQAERTVRLQKDKAAEHLKELLAVAGIVAALVWLLGSGK
jgi:transcriptional regulator with XRE-family HTH domain